MDIEQINHWIEEPLDARPEEIENRFFNSFENRRPEQITYNELRQINIPEGLTGNQLDGLVEEFGIEILAYYIPFHFHRPNRPWGIYLRRVGIDHVRRRLMEIAGRDGHNFRNLEIPTNVAEHILLLHELRHHAIEVAFTRVELQDNTRDEYQQYIRRKRNHNNTSSDTEAICNANVANNRSPFKTEPSYVGHTLRFRPPLPPNVMIRLDWNDYVSQFMIGQPAGYRDFARFTGFSSKQVLELLQLPRFWFREPRKDYTQHSQLSILRRLPVPIRVV